MKRVLFVCVENAGRSQMAEAFANCHGKGKLFALSAGTQLATQVNPLVVEAMKQKGIDISENKPKQLTTQMANQADLIVTMGCGVTDLCPSQLFKQKTIDWALEDPKGKPLEKIREIRDTIEQKVKELITQN